VKDIDRAANVLRNRGGSGGRAVDLGLDRCLGGGFFFLVLEVDVLSDSVAGITATARAASAVKFGFLGPLLPFK
jgi:hypothetical protein